MNWHFATNMQDINTDSLVVIVPLPVYWKTDDHCYPRTATRLLTHDSGRYSEMSRFARHFRVASLDAKLFSGIDLEILMAYQYCIVPAPSFCRITRSLLAGIPGSPAAIAIFWWTRQAIRKPCDHVVSSQKVWKTSLKACRRQVFQLPAPMMIGSR